MKFSPNDTRVKVIHEPREWGIVPEIANFFEGIYRVTTAGNYFDVKFIPQFQRNSDKWFLDTPEFFEDVTSLQEARLMTASDYPHTVTSSVDRAGTKESFMVSSSMNRNTIYYVTPKEFCTFRGELATVAEKTRGLHQYVEFDEINDFDFIKFILNNIMTSKKLERIRSVV